MCGSMRSSTSRTVSHGKSPYTSSLEIRKEIGERLERLWTQRPRRINRLELVSDLSEYDKGQAERRKVEVGADNQ
jgi:hypothetical protein